MKSARRALSVSICASLFTVAGAHAQNLIQNPYFDDHLTGWQFSPADQVSWTPSADYPVPGSGSAGALKLDGTAMPSLAFQCVPVRDDFHYVASMRVNSHCVGQRLYVFWTDASCIAGDALASAASVRADKWDLVTVPAQPPLGTSWAIVVADNPGGVCKSPAFVDDVVFMPETIFVDGFEQPGFL
jgi:hypothetical protein